MRFRNRSNGEGKDAPKVKVVKVKVKRTKLRSILKAAGLGAAVMYLFDPERGAARRNRLRDRSLALGRRAGRQGRQAARRAQSEAYGAFQQATHRVPQDPPMDDMSLKAKVETELYGRSDVEKGKLAVNVEDGIVVLRGEVDQPVLISVLPEAAMSIPGVTGVENFLHLPGEPAPNKQPAQEASEQAERQQDRRPA